METRLEVLRLGGLLALGLAAVLLAPAIPHQVLILDDGTEIPVREYEVLGERVRYFSSERGQWEEVPAAIVDTIRTQERNRRVQEELERNQRELRRERAAERLARTELHSVPLDDGVYYLGAGAYVPLEQVILKLDKSAGRTALNVIAPVPVIAGKQTMSIAGLHASTVTTDERPAFYLRLERFARFGISRLKPEPKKKRRIVQQIYTVPKAEEQVEAQEEVEVFRQQLAPLVYKIWPVEPLQSGEYAVVDFTAGASDLRAWDFSHNPGVAPQGR